METFDFDAALKQLQSGKQLTGKDGILTPLIKQLTEAALKAELELHLEEQTTKKMSEKRAGWATPGLTGTRHLATTYLGSINS